jgi:hypothetical protein
MDIALQAPAIQAGIFRPAVLKSRPILAGWLFNPLSRAPGGLRGL